MESPPTPSNPPPGGAADATVHRRHIFGNAASGVLLLVVNVGVALWITPTIVRTLGDRDYGIWDLLLSLCGYLGILDLGLGPAVVRYVAVAHQNNDVPQLRRLFNSSLAVFCLVGLIGLCVMVVLAFFPEAILHIERGSLPHAGLLFVLLGLNVAVGFPGNVLTGYVMGLQRQSILNLSRCVLAVVNAGAVWFICTKWEGPRLIALAVLTLASNLVLYGGIAIGLVLRERRLRLRRVYVAWSTMRELLAFGIKSMLLMVSDRIRRAAMPLVIAHFAGAGVGSLVFFAIPSRLAEYVGALGQSLGFPLTPYFAALSQSHDRPLVRREWMDLSRYTQSINLGAAVSLGALGYDFIARWMGPSYAENGLGVLVWLTAGLFAKGLTDNATRLLVGFARQEAAVRVLLPASIVTVGLAIPLTHFYGPTGAALAMFAVGDLSMFVVLYAACGILDLRLRDYLRSTALRVLIPVAIMAAAFAGLRLIVPPTTYLWMVAHAVIGALVYAAAVWRFTLTATERDKLQSRLRGRREPSREPQP